MIFLVVVATLFAGYGTAYLASDDVRYLTRAGLEETRILQARRADRRAGGATTPPIRRRVGMRSAWCSRAATTPPGSASRPRRPTPPTRTSGATRCCWCSRRRPRTASAPTPGSIRSSGGSRTRGSSISGRASGRLTGSPPRATTSTSGRPAPSRRSGWFNDPLLSTALTRDSVELAATVFHEIAHNTLYVKSATPFNESFAQFVGYRSAESFFTERADTANARQAADRLPRRDGARRVLRRPDRPARLAVRHEARFGRPGGGTSRGRGLGPRTADGPGGRAAPHLPIGRLPERPINNARLIGAAIYRTRLDLFDRWFDRHGRDVRSSVVRLGS